MFVAEVIAATEYSTNMTSLYTLLTVKKSATGNMEENKIFIALLEYVTEYVSCSGRDRMPKSKYK